MELGEIGEKKMKFSKVIQGEKGAEDEKEKQKRRVY